VKLLYIVKNIAALLNSQGEDAPGAVITIGFAEVGKG
jgi:hypothetical protein